MVTEAIATAFQAVPSQPAPNRCVRPLIAIKPAGGDASSMPPVSGVIANAGHKK